MAEEADQEHGTAATGGGVDPAALSIALGGASRARADAFLEKQSELTELQIKDLKREDRVRHWSLRVRHVSEVMKVTFEVSAALIALVLIAIIAAAIWAAAHDDTVVIEAFRVPPDMAQRGLTGDVIASQVLDQLIDMQSRTEAPRIASAYTSGFGNDIKVEIPNTGISIGEAYRYLAGWLGHQTRISGEVFRRPTGIVLTARTSNHPGARFEGSERDLDKLVGRAAEYIYGQTDPYRHALFLWDNDRSVEADAALKNQALYGPASEKPWAYAMWSDMALGYDKIAESVSRGREAVQLDPRNMVAQINAACVEATAEHEEQALRYARATKSAFNGEGRRQLTDNAATVEAQEADIGIAEDLGDFAAALTQYDALLSEPEFQGSHVQSAYMRAVDAAKMHDDGASRRFLGSRKDADLFALWWSDDGWGFVNLDFPRYHQYAALENWRAARSDLEQALATPEARAIEQRIIVRRQTWPWLALAEARSGDLNAALRLIAKTPLDCDLCMRVRGQIDAAAGNFAGAAFWFARAVASAPSIPFASTEWGAMLLHKGDYDGAIAKFEAAHTKGPHFADPLEMWGEALIAKNRSDLALAKFEEAEKCAPNWGRLHLKWGEALLWSGDKVGAHKQFDIATRLDLSTADKAELSRVSAARG